MTYTLFFIPDYQFQKVFYVFLSNNFLLFFFSGGPLLVEALGNYLVCHPLNPALVLRQCQSYDRLTMNVQFTKHITKDARLITIHL